MWVSRPRGFISFPLIPVCDPASQFPCPLPLCSLSLSLLSLSLSQNKSSENDIPWLVHGVLDPASGRWPPLPSPRSHCGGRCPWELSELQMLWSRPVRGARGRLGCVSRVSFVPRLSVGRRAGGRTVRAFPLQVDSVPRCSRERTGAGKIKGHVCLRHSLARPIRTWSPRAPRQGRQRQEVSLPPPPPPHPGSEGASPFRPARPCGLDCVYSVLGQGPRGFCLASGLGEVCSGPCTIVFREALLDELANSP